MYKYIIKRLLLMIPTLFGAAILVFFLMRLIPGDICELRLAGSGGFFDQSALDTCRQNLGLEQNPFIQFVTWVWGLLQFDFVISIWTGRETQNRIHRQNV